MPLLTKSRSYFPISQSGAGRSSAAFFPLLFPAFGLSPPRPQTCCRTLVVFPSTSASLLPRVCPAPRLPRRGVSFSVLTAATSASPHPFSVLTARLFKPRPYSRWPSISTSRRLPRSGRSAWCARPNLSQLLPDPKPLVALRASDHLIRRDLAFGFLFAGVRLAESVGLLCVEFPFPVAEPK